MKRSRSVPITLVASAASAAALAACGGNAEPMRCVDRTSGRVVADSVCARAGAPVSTTPGAAPTTTTAGGGIPPIFLWYYGGRMLNDMVSGGGYAPLAGRSYRTPGGGFAYDRNRGVTRVGGASAPGRVGGSRPAAPSARGGFGGIGSGRSGIS